MAEVTDSTAKLVLVPLARGRCRGRLPSYISPPRFYGSFHCRNQALASCCEEAVIILSLSSLRAGDFIQNFLKGDDSSIPSVAHVIELLSHGSSYPQADCHPDYLPFCGYAL